jgi:hypothetical protein
MTQIVWKPIENALLFFLEGIIKNKSKYLINFSMNYTVDYLISVIRIINKYKINTSI